MERTGSFLTITTLGLASKSMVFMKFWISMVQVPFWFESTITRLIMLFPHIGASSISLLLALCDLLCYGSRALSELSLSEPGYGICAI